MTVDERLIYDRYMDLAQAVIVLAANEYRKLCAKQKLSTRAEKRKEDIEKFFCSSWFSMLSKVNGKAILEDLQKEIAERQRETSASLPEKHDEP